MSTPDLYLTPIFLEIDGVRVELLEVSRHEIFNGTVWYIASVKIYYKDIVSRSFPLYVKNTMDLINKLRVEITKIKFIDYTYGLNEVRRLIT